MDESFSNMEARKSDESREVIIFHGFDGKRLNTLIDTLKRARLLTPDTILAATTEQSIQWTVKDLIAELSREHAWFKKQAEEKAAGNQDRPEPPEEKA